jgi:hypothetical protein
VRRRCDDHTVECTWDRCGREAVATIGYDREPAVVYACREHAAIDLPGEEFFLTPLSQHSTEREGSA